MDAIEATEQPASPLTRRDLLKAGAAGALLTAFPTIIPASAFGANERIVYGHIGVGGMGSSHIVPDACAALYHRQLFEETGGFDETFFAFGDVAILSTKSVICFPSGWAQSSGTENSMQAPE